MSGLLAIVTLRGRQQPVDVARQQLASIAHRGDREPALRTAPGVILGAVHRPTTPEAEREELPTTNRARRYWLAWDGRLDNRDELARELNLSSDRAAEDTDADYILAAFERWGDSVVEHLLGDWAIAIWDSSSERLFCAKDPLGWRQLFYCERDGLFMVGSEPQQLLQGPGVQPEINQDYLHRYLAGALQKPGQTAHVGISELEGGQSLVVQRGVVTVRRYWSYPSPAVLHGLGPLDYVEKFSEVFREAVSARLRSNGPVASYLSGGLDSSYVTTVAARESLELLAITAYAPDLEGLDEREYASTVVQATGIDQLEVDVSDCWVLSSKMLSEESFDSPAIPPQGPHIKRLAESAREAGASVVLDGEGGDDWLDADPRYVADALLRGHPRMSLRLARARARSRGVSWPSELAGSLLAALAPVRLRGSLDRIRDHESGEFLPLVALEGGWVHPSAAVRAPLWRREQSRRLRHHAHRQRSRSIVSWIDRQVLAPGHIELRSPFHDLRIIELMAATPDWIKQQRGRLRDIVRLAPPGLPDLVANRSTKGFFNGLVGPGLAVHERSRFQRAARTLAEQPGVIGTEVERATRNINEETLLRNWQLNWTIASAGLWIPQSATVHKPPAVELDRVRAWPM